MAYAPTGAKGKTQTQHIYTLLVIPRGGWSMLNSKEHYNKKMNKIIKSGQLK